MAFNFAPLLRVACGDAARRLRALRARSFLSFSQCNFTEKMPLFRADGVCDNPRSDKEGTPIL